MMILLYILGFIFVFDGTVNLNYYINSQKIIPVNLYYFFLSIITFGFILIGFANMEWINFIMNLC